MYKKNVLTYHGKYVFLSKDSFVITDFGEISIVELEKEYISLLQQLEDFPDMVMDSDYMFELKDIIEEFKKLKNDK